MDKGKPKKIKTVFEFVEEISKLTRDTPNRFFVFRGQGSHEDNVQSGAYRRLSNAYGKDVITINKLTDYHSHIINGARNRAETKAVIKNQCDMIVLGEIQHYGGATNLIDFTYNSLTALYFACMSKGENGLGKVYCLNTDSAEKFFEISFDKLTKPYPELINEIEKSDSVTSSGKYYKWIPPLENNRIIKQDSVFLLNGLGRMENSEFDFIFHIEKDDKKNLLSELNKSFFISEESLFPDFVGYVEANSAYKPLEKPDAHYFFYKAVNKHYQNDLNDAIGYYKQSAEINPALFEPMINMGLAFYGRGEYDEAIKLYNEALRIKPTDHRALNNLGNAYSRKGNYKEAIDYYNRAVEVQPRYNMVWNNLGNAYNSNGEYDEAIRCYNESLNIDSESYETLYNMGIAYYKKKNYQEAIENFEKAIQLKADDYEVWHDMGSVYYDMGDKEKAAECFIKAEKFK